MNYDANSEPTPNTVSTVTKHIKLYSDNHIHDCVGRIIKYCEYLDERNINGDYALDCLREAANDLAEACLDKKLEGMKYLIAKLYEKRPD